MDASAWGSSNLSGEEGVHMLFILLGKLILLILGRWRDFCLTGDLEDQLVFSWMAWQGQPQGQDYTGFFTSVFCCSRDHFSTHVGSTW